MAARKQPAPLSKNEVSETGAAEKAALPRDARARLAARTAFAVLLVALALWIARDFLAVIAWAAVIAITTWPLYVRFAGLVSGRTSSTVAALLFTIVCGIVLLVPLMLAVQQLAQAGGSIGQWITQLRESGIAVPEWLGQLPLAGEFAANWWQTNLSDPQAAAEWLRGVDAQSITAWTRALGGELLYRLFHFLLTLVALFFMFRDGAWLARQSLDTADRLLGGPGERLASKVADAIRGTVNGTVVIAVLEGILIGFGYVLAGVPDPLLLGLLTIACAMLPLGAEIAVTAAVVLLLVQGGSFFAGAALFAYGMAVTLIGDNFFWPALVGRTARLPFLLALTGILGGIHTFGLIGLFIGPVVMAALLTVWREWVDVEHQA